MKAKDLKNSILQMAVQGKLVPQDPGDEPASVLLERIRAERAKLIKEKKIKAPKGGESVIYLGSDGSRYEKRGKGEPVCIDEEIPFDIPDSWEWARLESVCSFGQCVNVELADVEPGTWMLDLEDIKKDTGTIIQKKRVGLDAKGSTKHLFMAGMVLYSKLRPYLNKVVIADERGVCTSEILPLDFGELNARFAQLFLMSPGFLQFAKEHSHGVKMPRLGTNDGKLSLVPIPPLAEQRRIANRVSELMPLVEEYGKLEDERETLDAALPERLRKSVLQMAVQGKLVPQNPSDEPASALLERIRAERAKLIKDKKIKAPKGGESVIYLGSDGRRYEKHGKGEPVCVDGEIPFEIPKDWEWARLSSVCFKLTDGSHNPPPKAANGYPVISAMSIDNRSVNLNRISRFVDRSGFEKENPRTRIKRGDIILGIIGGSIGNVAIFDCNEAVIAQRSVAIIDCGALNEYVSFALESPLFFGYYKNASGTAQGGIYLGALGDMLVPIPPLTEQHRIVECLGFVLASIS